MPGEYKYYFSFKTSSHGEYFGKQMVLILKVVSDFAAQNPRKQFPEVESRESPKR